LIPKPQNPSLLGNICPLK
jgi:hypothetical protein